MTRVLSLLILAGAVVAVLLPASESDPFSVRVMGGLFAASGLFWLLQPAQARQWPAAVVAGLLSTGGAWLMLSVLDPIEPAAGFWGATFAAWAMAWFFVERLASIETRNRVFGSLLRLCIPLLFGVWLLIIWEICTRGFGVPQVLLPSPSAIGARMLTSTDTLWADFKQTFIYAVLIGYALGCGSGFVIALLIDRSPLLQRGLLPIGNLVSALPIVGIAPIMVMWFGFDWHSKAAVVVVMTFFPMRQAPLPC